MTVCIAVLCRWNYAGPGEEENLGVIAITASDRMMTAADVQYEPPQAKVGRLSEKVFVLIAGDISLHSQAIKSASGKLRNIQGATTHSTAMLYGREIQVQKRQEAEDLILAPLGLNTDTFHAQQQDFSPSFVSSVSDQLQSYRGDDVEAIVIGNHGGYAELYHVDSRGAVTCHDDIGFCAIGMGAWHAKSLLMQRGYINGFNFTAAVSAIYAAKKAAEIAPGVGTATDMNIMFRDHIMPLWPKVQQRVDELHGDYIEDRDGLVQDSINLLQMFITEPQTESSASSQGVPGGGAQADVAPSREEE